MKEATKTEHLSSSGYQPRRKGLSVMAGTQSHGVIWDEFESVAPGE